MRKIKAIMAFLTAMTMTMGAVGITAHAEERTDKYSFPIDVNEKFEGLRGDMDGNGKLTIRDVSEIAKIISTIDTKKITAKADYNMDGYVSIRDAAAIAKELAIEAQKSKKEREQTEKELSKLEEELSELDPDTSIEDIEGIISGYIDDSAPEEAPVDTEPTGIAGDLNNDGAVTVKDAALIAKYLANRIHMTQEEFDALTVQGDYNGDGVVNIKDSRNIVEYLVNKSKNKSSENDDKNEEKLIKELSELDPDTPIEDIEGIISGYIDDSAPEEAPVDTEPTGIAGDLNNDGAVTVKDAALLAKYLANYIHMTREEFDALTVQGDYNGDGQVNVRDVVDMAHDLAVGKNNKQEDTQPKEVIPGDMNGDGEVTLRDGYIMAYVLANAKTNDHDTGEWLTKGDYNGDGQFNVRDSARVIDDVIASGVLGEKYKKRSDIVIVKGDADLDGEVGLADITLIAKFNLSSAAYPFKNEVAYISADLNSDDKVDGLDTSALIENQLGHSSETVPSVSEKEYTFDDIKSMTSEELQALFDEKGMTYEKDDCRVWTPDDIHSEWGWRISVLLDPTAYMINLTDKPLIICDKNMDALADEGDMEWDTEKIKSSLALPEEYFTIEPKLSNVYETLDSDGEFIGQVYCQCYIRCTVSDEKQNDKLTAAALNYVQLNPDFKGFHADYPGA